MTPNLAMVKLSEKAIRKSPSGMACHFVKLDDEWGVKCFRRAVKRDEAYDCQKKAAVFGLGPEVGEKFQFGKYFCYITQVAQIIALPDDIDNLDYDDYCAMEENYADEIAKLREELDEKIGFWFNDDHIGNVGFIGNRLVCIDFGICDGCE